MKKYFLGRDNDCHWYIIDADKEGEWYEWVNLDGDDERCWNVPDFAESIDSRNRRESSWC